MLHVTKARLQRPDTRAEGEIWLLGASIPKEGYLLLEAQNRAYAQSLS